jgi:origin recognition complex subunit 2
MVTLEESRRYAVNYFRLISDAQVVNKAVAKKSTKEVNYKIEDTDYVELPPFEGAEKLMAIYQDTMLEQYIFELSHGFNLLFYGFGRKLKVVEMIKDSFVSAIFINGYDPVMTLNSVYAQFNNNGIDLRNRTGTEQNVLTIVYGLDSFKLRNENFYRLLADATERGDIRLVVTVEDPSCHLLWSPKTTDKFNFIHHDATTLIPYVESEMESLPDIISTRSGNKRSIKGALFVLQSLTPNARAIFKLLAEHQIAAQSTMTSTTKDSDSETDSENEEEETCQDGLAHLELYKLAQSKFLISNEQAFRSIMTEFLDHELIKLARSSVNGAEVLRIAFSIDNIKDIVSMLATM